MRVWERVDVLLLRAACATWVAWMVGRTHERRLKMKPTTTEPQPRRRRVVKDGLRGIAERPSRFAPGSADPTGASL